MTGPVGGTDGERRCIVTRKPEDRAALVRFVANGTELVPDLSERLPGRGAWVGADRGRIDEAVRRNLFSHVFQRKIAAPADLAAHVERQVAARIVSLLGLARRAGHAVHGHERCKEALDSGSVGLLIVAEDAGTGALRLTREASDRGVAAGQGPDKVALGKPFGVGQAAYIALAPGSLCDRIKRDLHRLAGLRPVLHGTQA